MIAAIKCETINFDRSYECALTLSILTASLDTLCAKHLSDRHYTNALTSLFTYFRYINRYNITFYIVVQK